MALVAVPFAVITVITPLLVPAGATAVIEVSLFTVKLAAFTPLNFTAVAPVKLVPVIVTLLPTKPVAGLNEAMVGTTTVKLVAETAQPPGVSTRMTPVLAPAGTVTVI